MALLPELWFAYRFPFSRTARELVKKNPVDFARIPTPLYKHAIRWLERPPEKDAFVNIPPPSEQAILSIQSLALAKILVSLMNDPVFYEKPAGRLMEQTLYFLQHDPKPEAVALHLVADLDIRIEKTGDDRFTLPVAIFLSVATNDPATRLVNQSVDAGRVELSLNGLQRWLAQWAYQKTLASLPADTSDLPSELKKAAMEFRQRLTVRHRERVLASLPSGGAVHPELFTPCMADLYARLAAGENLPHMARFDLASFLIAVHMPVDAVVQLFSHAPNFSEKITRYQVERIKTQGLSAPACAKVREHGYCPLPACAFKHPVSHYQREARRQAVVKRKHDAQTSDVPDAPADA